MTQEQLFALAIGIQKPWFIESIDLDLTTEELNIRVSFECGSEFVYTDEGTGEQGRYKAYDTREKTWRHMNFFQYKCYLHCRVPRVKTSSGKIKQVKTPWEGSSFGFTLLFEALILQFSKIMPINKICKMMDIYDSKVWQMLYTYTEKCREMSDYSEVKSVGMDETSITGHNYITTFVDMTEKKTLFVTEGKDNKTVKEFVEDLTQHGGSVENIIEASCDMSPAFVKGIEENLPHAEITFDKFHVIKKINSEIDEIRKEELKTNPLLKNTKYIFLKNRENYTNNQKLKYEEFKIEGLNTKTFKAMEMRESFQQIYQAPDKITFEFLLNNWCDWVTESKISQMQKVKRTIKKHWDKIVNYAVSKITNAILEGFNSIFQAAKNKAKGYKRPQTIKTIIYLLTGKLDFSKINTFCATHSLL
jgi:transposase